MRRAVRWPISIHTAQSMRTVNQRLARRNANVARILGAMKRGATLNLHYQNGRPIWRLSSGPFVMSEVAAAVIASQDVTDVGDSLFPNHPGQTWRYLND